MPKETIDTFPDLQEYFYEEVRGAIRHQQLIVTPDAEFYLVHLLSRFSKSERVFSEQGDRLEEEALFQLLDRALQADRESRIMVLKRLGDVALYFAGYFPESLSRKLIDLSYYIQMGGTAYGSIPSLLTRSHEQELFQELAIKFESWVGVLSEVSAHSQSHTDHDLLKLYEKWLQSGSRVAQDLLHQKGIIPHRGNKESH